MRPFEEVLVVVNDPAPDDRVKGRLETPAAAIAFRDTYVERCGQPENILSALRWFPFANTARAGPYTGQELIEVVDEDNAFRGINCYDRNCLRPRTGLRRAYVLVQTIDCPTTERQFLSG